MGEALVQKMLPIINNIDWPQSPEASELGRRVFEVGLDQADDYRTDPKVLTAALRTFQTSKSRPYAYAGVAYTLIKAAREKDGSYAQVGLDAALEWLEKAQELAPNIFEINVIEPFIYIYSGRFDDARVVLDYLETIDNNHYYILRAEIAYWQEQGELDKAIHWYGRAIETAETVPQKLRVKRELGDSYFRFKQYEEAVKIYKEVVPLATDDAALWHTMSVAYWRLGNYEEAAHCNRRALQIQDDLPGALKMQEALKDKFDSGGLSKRLFGS
jgi:tetratricopeptide (TPR) repeat protein